MAPFRGGAFIARHSLWGHLALPVAANVLVAAGASAIVFMLADHWLPAAGGAWAQAGKTVLSLLVAVPVFLVFYPLIAGPFIDTLTEKVELIVRGSHPRVPFWRGVFDAVCHGAAKSALYLFALGVSALLSLFTGVGGAVGLALGALFLAFDGFDYPLARRRVGFSGKWRYLFQHPALTFGYAASSSVFFMVPLAFIVAPPLAAVGATLAYLDSPDHLEIPHGPPHPLPL